MAYCKYYYNYFVIVYLRGKTIFYVIRSVDSYFFVTFVRNKIYKFVCVRNS